MKSRAAVALEAGKPLELVEIDVEGPKAGEVLVKMRRHQRLPYRCLYAVRGRPGGQLPGGAGP